LKAYKELDKAAKQLWVDLDDTILKPRTNLRLDRKSGGLPAIKIEEVVSPTPETLWSSTDLLQNRLSISDNSVDRTIKSLFVDLERVIRFLVDNLPPEFIDILSKSMMPTLVGRILDTW
jgi:centromere/kinetochore protein ZW10